VQIRFGHLEGVHLLAAGIGRRSRVVQGNLGREQFLCSPFHMWICCLAHAWILDDKVRLVRTVLFSAGVESSCLHGPKNWVIEAVD
jgi:hypothetical protein